MWEARVKWFELFCFTVKVEGECAVGAEVVGPFGEVFQETDYLH